MFGPLLGGISPPSDDFQPSPVRRSRVHQIKSWSSPRNQVDLEYFIYTWKAKNATFSGQKMGKHGIVAFQVYIYIYIANS